jgi:hypothetical protein
LIHCAVIVATVVNAVVVDGVGVVDCVDAEVGRVVVRVVLDVIGVVAAVTSQLSEDERLTTGDEASGRPLQTYSREPNRIYAAEQFAVARQRLRQTHRN